MRSSEITINTKIDDARTEVKVGDEIEVKITAIDRKKRSINVSVRAKETDDEATAVEEYGTDTDTSGRSTLGDLLKEHLDK